MEKTAQNNELPILTPEASADYNNGFIDGRKFVERSLFKLGGYTLLDKDYNLDSIFEIVFEKSLSDIKYYEAPKRGYWEKTDLDGNKITAGAVCSECQKYTRMPEKYCPKCGAQNMLGYGEC